MGENTITDPKIGDWAEHNDDHGSRVQITQITMGGTGGITYRVNVIEHDAVIGTILISDLDYFNDGSWVWHDRTQMTPLNNPPSGETPARAVLKHFPAVEVEGGAPRTSFMKTIMGWMR